MRYSRERYQFRATKVIRKAWLTIVKISKWRVLWRIKGKAKRLSLSAVILLENWRRRIRSWGRRL